MKIDRLIGILIYLLNRNIVSAKALAEKFEVSQRTIQRDIDALNLAGIPIVSIVGANGGYGIAEGFRIDRQLASDEDFLHIITALKGLCTGYGNKKLDNTLEKMIAVAPPGKGLKQKLYLDFGVLKEDDETNHFIEIIEQAIETEKVVEFDYTNADNMCTHRIVEPITLTYKWYAWYLFGYCREKNNYRLFKLLRIRNLIVTNKAFSIKHRSSEELLREHGSRDNRQYLNIKLRCNIELRVAAMEAFPGSEIIEEDSKGIVIRFRVPRNERMWFASLLSFGNKITVLEPEELKEMLVEKAEEIINLYSE